MESLMNLFFWPSIFFSLLLFNFEIHQRFVKKRNAIEDQFALDWNQLLVPKKYIQIEQGNYE